MIQYAKTFWVKYDITAVGRTYVYKTHFVFAVPYLKNKQQTKYVALKAADFYYALRSLCLGKLIRYHFYFISLQISRLFQGFNVICSGINVPSASLIL